MSEYHESQDDILIRASTSHERDKLAMRSYHHYTPGSVILKDRLRRGIGRGATFLHVHTHDTRLKASVWNSPTLNLTLNALWGVVKTRVIDIWIWCHKVKIAGRYTYILTGSICWVSPVALDQRINSINIEWEISGSLLKTNESFIHWASRESTNGFWTRLANSYQMA